MSEPREPYLPSTGSSAMISLDVTPAEKNLIMRLRQHRGMIIIDANSMCLWAAGKVEQCNGKTPGVSTLPYRMDFAGS